MRERGKAGVELNNAKETERVYLGRRQSQTHFFMSAMQTKASFLYSSIWFCNNTQENSPTSSLPHKRVEEQDREEKGDKSTFLKNRNNNTKNLVSLSTRQKGEKGKTIVKKKKKKKK